MYYIPSGSDEPPMGRLASVYWIVGVLVVVPVLSALFVGCLAHVGVFGDDTGVWIWLGVWQVGSVLWMLSAYRLDAWDEARCAQRHRSAAGSPLVLRRRNRLLVGGRRGRLRRIAWFCLEPGSRILLLAASTAACLIVAHGLVSIEDQANSVGPQPLIALFFVAAAVMFATMTVSRLRARARLIRGGRLLAATVTDVGIEGSRWRIGYRLLTPSGQAHDGREYLRYRPRGMPSAGDELAILYEEKCGAQVL